MNGAGRRLPGPAQHPSLTRLGAKRAWIGQLSSLPVARKSFNLSQVSDLMPLVQSRQLRVESGDGPDDLLSTQDSRLSTRGSGVSGRLDLSGRSMTCRAGAEPR